MKPPLIPSQKKVWNAIAPEWYEFKNHAGEENIKFIKSQKGKILDLGCGAGRNFTKTKAEIYALDFSPEMIKYAKKKAKQLKIKNIQFFVADAKKLPFEENFFDSALCTALLHCIPTKTARKKAIKELYRVLKPKSKALIGVWNVNSKRFKGKRKERLIGWQEIGKRYYYLYDENEIQNQFKEAGFKIIKSLNSELMINFIVER